MSSDPERAAGKVPEDSLGSLSGCLVDGDAEQRRRERRVRRRALVISVALQSAALAALIFVPLFSKAERITFAIVTPVPPYSPYQNVSHNRSAQPPRHRVQQNPSLLFAPPNIPPTIAMRDPALSATQTDDSAMEEIGPGIPGDGLIALSDPRQNALPPPRTEHQIARPQVVRMTQLDPAMLIHRVEPVYPPLARDTRREGRVELRAIIGTDGTIQSLQIVVSDPLFNQSAMEAVRQWRYRPTILSGKPVEIDTYITVIYTHH